VLERLAEAGYRTRAAVLPAGVFGAATRRARLIIVGVRADLGLAPSHPGATARPVTVREAWAGLPPEPVPEPPPLTDRMRRLALMVKPGRSGMHALGERGGRASYYNLARLALDRPGPAIASTFRNSDYIHPVAHRYLTVAEMMRIQGIPDAYAWPEGTTYAQAHNRIGNSVSPLLTAALGAHLRKTVLDAAPARAA